MGASTGRHLYLVLQKRTAPGIAHIRIQLAATSAWSSADIV